MSSRTYIAYGFGIQDVVVSDVELCQFAMEHEDTLIDLGAGDVIKYVMDGKTNIKEDFYDFEDPNSCECGAYAIISAVMSKETGYSIEYRYGEDCDAIMFPECYPWNLTTEETVLTKDTLEKLFEKYFRDFDAKQKPDFVEVVSYG